MHIDRNNEIQINQVPNINFQQSQFRALFELGFIVDKYGSTLEVSFKVFHIIPVFQQKLPHNFQTPTLVSTCHGWGTDDQPHPHYILICRYKK
jgi:hypothetical protein